MEPNNQRCDAMALRPGSPQQFQQHCNISQSLSTKDIFEYFCHHSNFSNTAIFLNLFLQRYFRYFLIFLSPQQFQQHCNISQSLFIKDIFGIFEYFCHHSNFSNTAIPVPAKFPFLRIYFQFLKHSPHKSLLK